MTGYAYKCNINWIIIRTLTDTIRGAKVNALWIVAGYMCTMDHSDNHIENKFSELLGDSGTIVQVEISEVNK